MPFDGQAFTSASQRLQRPTLSGHFFPAWQPRIPPDDSRLQIVDNSLTSYNPPPYPVPPIHNKNSPEMTEEPTRSPINSPGSDAGQGLWQACVEQLAQDLPEQQFNTWILSLIHI